MDRLAVKIRPRDAAWHLFMVVSMCAAGWFVGWGLFQRWYWAVIMAVLNGFHEFAYRVAKIRGDAFKAEAQRLIREARGRK